MAGITIFIGIFYVILSDAANSKHVLVDFKIKIKMYVCYLHVTFIATFNYYYSRETTALNLL
jgi:hypothetical protein